MDKQPVDPEIEREARAIYGLILAGRDDDARARLMGLGLRRVAVASAMIQINCRWSARVASFIDGATCPILIIAILVIPVAVSITVGQKRDWYWFSNDFLSYCLVAGLTFVVEAVIYVWLDTKVRALPFHKARDRADKIKMDLVRDALLAETEARPEVISALLDARVAFAANKELDETVYDSALQEHLKSCVGAVELNDRQKNSMLTCLEEATWHLLEGVREDDYKRSDAKRKIANVGIALMIVEFYQQHVDKSALETLNIIAKCEPVTVSPKWRPVIEAARRVPGVKVSRGRRTTKDAGNTRPENQPPELDDSPIKGRVYNVTRAFQVEQVEDEGPHFFLELVDGSVLLMSGQYIYDIELRDYPGFTQSRFPSSKIIIRESDREIFCAGEPLDYETLPAEFWDVWGQGYVPDMTLFTDVTFDELWRIGDRLE